ncbi:MAG: PilZ domain-containing protein [SAR324 cluster bacterium]|nr:PilZ domain-containing protein [SAR324 cluster bacterium]
MRKEERFDYHHRLSITHHHKLAITVNRQFGRGEVLNWSPHGLKVVSCIPIEAGKSYQVRFHIQKDHGLSGRSTNLSREGSVCWVLQKDDLWYMGIHLEEKLEKLNESISEEDSCYMFMMSQEA